MRLHRLTLWLAVLMAVSEAIPKLKWKKLLLSFKGNLTDDEKKQSNETKAMLQNVFRKVQRGGLELPQHQIKELLIVFKRLNGKKGNVSEGDYATVASIYDQLFAEDLQKVLNSVPTFPPDRREEILKVVDQMFERSYHPPEDGEDAFEAALMDLNMREIGIGPEVEAPTLQANRGLDVVLPELNLREAGVDADAARNPQHQTNDFDVDLMEWNLREAGIDLDSIDLSGSTLVSKYNSKQQSVMKNEKVINAADQPKPNVDQPKPNTNQSNSNASTTESDQCPVCIESMGDSVKCLPCMHKFHESCIVDWYNYGKDFCPVCRVKFVRGNNEEASSSRSGVDSIYNIDPDFNEGGRFFNPNFDENRRKRENEDNSVNFNPDDFNGVNVFHDFNEIGQFHDEGFTDDSNYFSEPIWDGEDQSYYYEPPPNNHPQPTQQPNYYHEPPINPPQPTQVHRRPIRLPMGSNRMPTIPRNGAALPHGIFIIQSNEPIPVLGMPHRAYESNETIGMPGRRFEIIRVPSVRSQLPQQEDEISTIEDRIMREFGRLYRRPY